YELVRIHKHPDQTTGQSYAMKRDYSHHLCEHNDRQEIVSGKKRPPEGGRKHFAGRDLKVDADTELHQPILVQATTRRVQRLDAVLGCESFSIVHSAARIKSSGIRILDVVRCRPVIVIQAAESAAEVSCPIGPQARVVEEIEHLEDRINAQPLS